MFYLHWPHHVLKSASFIGFPISEEMVLSQIGTYLTYKKPKETASLDPLANTTLEFSWNLRDPLRKCPPPEGYLIS